MAFEDLEATMMRGSVLESIDVTKPFEIETDASDFALGGVFIQEGHPSLMKVESSMMLKRGTLSPKKKCWLWSIAYESGDSTSWDHNS